MYVTEGVLKVSIVSRMHCPSVSFSCEFCLNDCISHLNDGHVDTANFTVTETAIWIR